MKFDFAKAVRQRRLTLGVTQEELAWRAGLHRTYLAGIEAGSRNPSLQSIVRLAQAMEISLAALFANVEQASAPGQAAPEDNPPGRAVDILLVEDNPRDVELTLRALKKAGLTNHVRVLTDGAVALDYLFCKGAYAGRSIADRPHLVLLDLNLPKVSGLDVLRRVKADARTASIPVVVLTGSRQASDVAESRRLGAETYILKPVDFERLSGIVPQLHMRWALLEPGARTFSD
jgi:two-component system, response regulator